MYTPQFRFAMLVSLFVIFGTLAQVLYSYSFGKNGLDFNVYLEGVLMVGSSTLGGFFFIWVCSKFITFNGLKTTGFEGVFRDEYGTNFVFKHPIRLTKFLPDLIAKPTNPGISDLEADLIAFLSAYKEMPIDINDPKSISLYDYAIGMWTESRRTKNTNHMHHIVALSKYLGLVYVYKSKRKSAPTWQFWIRDQIKYSKRCLFHGGLSSFVLSTMPSFHNLDERTKRTLLIAVRFADTPISIPSNCEPITFSLYENAHKAEQRLKKKINKISKMEINPSETDILQFKQQTREYFQPSMMELNLNPNTPLHQSAGVYLGFGLAIVKLPHLLHFTAKNLTPDIRSEMDLWDTPVTQHQTWNLLLDMLKESDLIAYEIEEQKFTSDLNTFIIDDVAVKNCVLLKLEQKRYPKLRAKLDSLPACNKNITVEKDEQDIIKEISLKSSKIDEFLKTLYS